MAISDIYTGGYAGDYWIPSTTHAYTDAGSTLVTADGDLIYQINGQRASINLVQSASAARATYKTNITPTGYPVYRCDGTRGRWADFNLDFGSPGESTIFAVVSRTAHGAYHNFYEIDTLGTYEPNCWSNASNDWKINESGFGFDTLTYSPGNSLHFFANRNKTGSTDDLYVNASKVASGTTAGTHCTGSKGVSVHHRSNADVFRGDVALFGIVNKYLSDAEALTLYNDCSYLLVAATGGRNKLNSPKLVSKKLMGKVA